MIKEPTTVEPTLAEWVWTVVVMSSVRLSGPISFRESPCPYLFFATLSVWRIMTFTDGAD